jgi:hypothetical protein
MSHNFSRVPRAEIQRSSFNRSHGHKTTFDAGYLVPFFVDEVLPGDTFNCRATLFARLATPIVPFMDNMFMDTFFFFVPCRLLWENWERFNGAQDNPGDSTDYLVPTLADNTTFDVGTLGDYFGIPTGVSLSNINSMPFRAYNLIWNEWFRDENLQDSVDVPRDDGTDDVMDYQLLRRGKRHDYFTSCLPWPQKGPGVELPVGGLADVKFADDYDVNAPIPLTFNINQQAYPATYWDTDTFGNGYVPRLPSTGGLGSLEGSPVNIYNPLAALPTGGLVADLSTATAVTINSFRMAFQVQRLYERDARGGTRYTEMLTAHFGVVSPDARLQRPEYLGGSSSPIVVNPVQQTSSTDNTTPQGNLAAYGLVGSRVHGFTKSFVEHGYIIGLVNVRADLTYQQGLNRLWSRQTRFDFYWPALAHLGEQAVLNKEIYADGTAADDDVFGYQERFAEYRYFPSKVTGKFRSTYAQPLDAWHLSQKFETRPVLNAEFIVDEPPVDRVIAVPSEPHFLFDSYIQLNCVRPMPVYSVPGLIDHF